MRDVVEIGKGRSATTAYSLRDISIVPSRRTRDQEDVSTAWQIDAFRFDIPLVATPSDATMSPASIAEVNRLGGLGVLNGEGLWSRYEDPQAIYAWLAALSDQPEVNQAQMLQEAYAAPVDIDLLIRRVKELREGGGTVAVRLSPQNAATYADAVVAAGVDLLVIQGTVVSAEFVTTEGEPLNLKTYVSSLDVPVIVGGCTDYQTALHLMRTGAAGVIVGYGADPTTTTGDVLGIGVPMATAIAEAAAARRDYLDETGGRYVHVIADGEISTSGDLAKALACGADAVMLGRPLRVARETPASGRWWHTAAAHPKLPRGILDGAVPQDQGLAEVFFGPAVSPTGETNLFGALRRVMAKSGYRDLKEFQKVGLVVGG